MNKMIDILLKYDCLLYDAMIDTSFDESGQFKKCFGYLSSVLGKKIMNFYGIFMGGFKFKKIFIAKAAETS